MLAWVSLLERAVLPRAVAAQAQDRAGLWEGPELTAVIPPRPVNYSSGAFAAPCMATCGPPRPLHSGAAPGAHGGFPGGTGARCAPATDA